MERDDSIYLRHILDAGNRIAEYLEGIDHARFDDGHLIQDAVIRQLEIIGEAVKRVSNTLRNSYPEIPRQDVAGMRDKLNHGYFGVDLETVWLSVRDDLPLLMEQIE
jgi:uncharacterized protein with HEPN domain